VRDGTQSITGSYAANILAADNEYWDAGSNYNTSTYKFKVPVTGYYLCGGVCNFGDLSVASGGDMFLVLRNDTAGVEYRLHRSGCTAVYQGLNGSIPIYAAANDYLYIFVAQNNSGTRTLESGTIKVFFIQLK
jgi:hypothetical protein